MPLTIAVAPSHPLIQLAQVIPWQALAQLVLPDLQHTTAKGKWWIGRKLQLRVHLGAFLLQWIYNLTDRQVEWGIKDNAAYQLFGGLAWIDVVLGHFWLLSRCGYFIPSTRSPDTFLTLRFSSL